MEEVEWWTLVFLHPGKERCSENRGFRLRLRGLVIVEYPEGDQLIRSAASVLASSDALGGGELLGVGHALVSGRDGLGHGEVLGDRVLHQADGFGGIGLG